MSEQHLRNSSRSGLSAPPHAALEDPAPDLTKTGLNPLYGSAIVGGTPPTQAMQAPAPPKGQDGEAGKSNKKKGKSQSGEGREARRGEAPKVRRTASSQRKRPSARGGSPQSILTTSTSQSPSSSSSRHVRPTGPSPPQAAPAERSRSRSNTPPTRRQSEAAQDSVPAPLVPALLCPVPPPPRKRKVRGDIETGGGAGAAAEGEEGTVLEDAPDKTLMEVLQKYLKKQDLYTRIVLVVILLLLAGGVLGAYGAMLTLAIQDKNTKYIVLASLFSLILFWVLWKYCFSGDQKLQDQSQIAQDIATLYAAIPDHTAVRGVSEKGRAQFTDFKYEKSEMMFTAVTDDGVSLGSERGSELMMDGADPSCPLCNIAYVEGADLCLLPCLHVFHKHCINKWCNRHIVCPLCKRHLEAPEPLHTLTATSGSTHGAAAGMARSEPGGGHHNHHQQHHHHGARGAADSRGTWRQMLGTAAPGPLSGHGSERGLGGTRSEDGRWNDRVLNAAQQQMDGGRQNRVTSFSSETRRANSARGRAGERGPAGRGLGPPQSSSAGASALRGPQRAQSVSGSVGGRHHRIQRKRSSSFNTASERRGSGRVAHGTAPHRGGGGGGSFRGPDSNSPRARSDLGVGSKDADRIRANTDAMLSRHASRRNNGAGGTKVLTKPMFGEDGAGAWASSGGKGKGKGKGKAKRGGGGGGGEGAGEASGSSQQGGGARGPAVITVRKVKTVGAGAAEAGGSSKKKQQGRRTRTVSAAAVGGAVGGGVGDFARSGGESESDFGGERVFTTNSSRHNHYDDDLSPDEVTTKALTYGPRKSQVSRENSASKESSGGHRRQWSTGSTSADEVGSGKKSRRRSASGSKSGSGNHMLIAGAAATAEAVSKLLGRPSEDRSAYSVSSSRGGVGGARVSAGAEHSEASSGGDSGSDGRAEGGSDRRSRRNSARLSGGRRGSQLQQHRTTPPKTGPVTKGTPAPPMAAARVATWNSSSSAPAPVFDASLSHPMSDAEHQHQLQRAYAGDGRGRDGAGGGPSEVMVGASSVEATSSSPMETPVKGTPSRGWGFRIPTSAGSAEFFGLGVGSHGSQNGSSISHGNGTSNGHGNSCASAEAADGEHSDGGGFAAGPSLTSKVFSRSSGPSRRGGGAVSGVRLFGSGAASTSSRTGPAPVRGGNSAFALDSENSPPGGRIDLTASSSVQELIQTYEKSRSSSDEKGAHSDDWSARAPVTSEGKKRNSKTFTRRRGSGASAASMNELAATESELDDDQIDRPKLTYKRKGSRHGHSRSRTPSEGEAMARAAMYGSASEGGLDLSEGHGHHPNGDDWADEEPFHRPKLSYGGGLRSSSRRSSTGSESGRRSST